MRTALIVGGTGQIGLAAARRLADDGWDVTLAARTDADVGFRVSVFDRSEAGALESAVGQGVDLLLDVVPYTLADAEQVVALRGRVGSVIAISSAAVYADAEGLTFDSQEQGLFPRFPVPISERQRTCVPGEETYSQRKRAIELALLEHDDLRATIVRPGAIHGPYTRFSREWFFVKRIVDGRRFVVLARRGESRFHTTATENLAELIRLAARRPRRRVLNCGDPDAPTAVGIGRACAAALGYEFAEVLLPGPEQGSLGDHPWNVATPFVMDMSEAALDLGYRPVATYENAVADTCRWLVEHTRGRDWREALPEALAHMEPFFDYAAEDAFLQALAT